MQQLTIRMPDEDLSRIEKIAKSTGLKKSDITRMAIKKFVEEYNNEKERNLYSRASHLIGIIESGKPDLGRNHRRYLIKKIKGSKWEQF
jgi:metal-responsive CopG/Arc/MetJ family transcriptional regulator